ncbi:MAG: sulfite exporter TauE/SafE family protein [Maricaulaceae bacterium]|jgi:uncharacterized membrane protein YfcA
MELWQAAALALVGVLAGWLNVMAGGGSLLTVPMMVFFGLPGPVANGTNRIAILAQNIVAVSAFRSKGFADFRLSGTLALAACVGAAGGAQVGVRLAGEAFDRVVAVIMVAVLILMLTGGDKAASKPPEGAEPGKPRNLLLGHALMVGAGFWGGFIQIGVGFILMPILHRVMGFDLVRVNMHKVAIVLAYTIVALGLYAAQVQIMWVAGLALALGNSIGGWLGAHTTVSKGEVWIRRVFVLAVIAMIAGLVLR